MGSIMLIQEFIIAAIFGMIFSALFALLLRRRIRRIGYWWLLLLYVMIIWAGGIWLKPFGPTLFGIQWMPFLVIGIAFSLIVAFFSPRRPPYGRRETLEKLEEMAQEKQMEKATYMTLGALFWTLIICLFIAVVLRHLS